MLITSLDLDRTSVKENNGWVDFVPIDAANDQLIVRFATSFISKQQAIFNLQLEIPRTKTFQDVLVETQSEWRAVLSRVAITKTTRRI